MISLEIHHFITFWILERMETAEQILEEESEELLPTALAQLGTITTGAIEPTPDQPIKLNSIHLWEGNAQIKSPSTDWPDSRQCFGFDPHRSIGWFGHQAVCLTSTESDTYYCGHLLIDLQRTTNDKIESGKQCIHLKSLTAKLFSPHRNRHFQIHFTSWPIEIGCYKLLQQCVVVADWIEEIRVFSRARQGTGRTEWGPDYLSALTDLWHQWSFELQTSRHTR